MNPLARLHRLGVSCVVRGNPTDLLHDLLDTVLASTRAQSAKVQLRDPGTQSLTVAAHRGLSGQPDAPCESIPLRSGNGTEVGVILIYGNGHTAGEDRTLVELCAQETADFLEISQTLQAVRTTLEREREERACADAANRTKDEFLATLAHELRQPLAAAMLAVEVQKQSPQPERRQRARDVLEQQMRHIAQLVADLSEPSRILRGNLEFHRERLDVRAVLQRALEMSTPLFDERRHTVTLSLGDEPSWVRGDPTRLRQVFANLLQNAASYTPVEGHIRLSLDGDPQHVRFTLSDDGDGIPPGALERIFQLFDRGPQPSDSRRAGIGLAVVRRLVEAHGGTVTAASEGAGCGSVFTVTLPRDPSS